MLDSYEPCVELLSEFKASDTAHSDCKGFILQNMHKFISLHIRKLFRRLNWYNIFYFPNQPPNCIVAGFTRSGTTFISDIIAGSAGWRMIHEPLNPCITSNIRDRDSYKHISESQKCREELTHIFGGRYRGSRTTNHGGRVLYSGTLIKVVRANFYLGAILNIVPNTKLIFVIRNPCACVASRIRLGWQVPDMSNCIEDIQDTLTQDQIQCYSNDSPYHIRTAAAWCMDNVKALNDLSSSERTRIIQYENFVDNPIAATMTLHEFLNVSNDVSCSSVRKENELLKPLSGFNVERIKCSWKQSLSNLQQSEIVNVVDIFNMRDLLNDYDIL